MNQAPQAIDWDAITQEINDEFSDLAAYESRLIDSYLISGNWIEGA